MRKKLGFSQHPPGLIVITYEDQRVLQEYLDSLSEEYCQALEERGYTLVHLKKGLKLHSMNDRQLAEMGLRRFKPAPKVN